jgi:N-acetylglutamate synthase-like GNAT family acetyltransferase
MPPIESLEWDSAFFGVRIGRVSLGSAAAEQLSQAVGWADQRRIECLYWLVDGADAISPRAAETCGFHLVDVQLTFETKLLRGAGLDQRPLAHVRLFKPLDLPCLLALARGSHGASRYFYDGNFAEDRCAALYEEWIKRALRRDSDIVLVAENENQPSGYCVCHLSGDRIGSIDLIAVDPKWRGGYIGTALMSAALDHFDRSGMRSATVVTQGRNIASQRLYQRSGFVTKSVKLWYHRWAGIA